VSGRADGGGEQPPAFEEHLCLQQGVKHLAGQELAPQLPVEALRVTVLPKRSFFDRERLHSDPFEPSPNPRCSELRTLVAADVVRRAFAHEQVVQPLGLVRS